MVDKTKFAAESNYYPYKTGAFVGKWVYLDEQLPDNYLRRTCRIILNSNQSYYFYPDKENESQYKYGEYEIAGNSISFYSGAKSIPIVFVYYVSSDTLNLSQ